MLKSNQINGYMAHDKYLYFTFNHVHSSKYNLFIVSNNDMKMVNAPSGSASYVNAMFQDGSYYLGTSNQQKTFKHKCAASGLDLATYKQMMKWLTKGTVGFLCFDSDPDWGWSAVLESVSDTTYVERGGELIVEFELTWKTIGSYLARNAYTSYLTQLDKRKLSEEQLAKLPSCNGYYNTSVCSNSYGIPVINIRHNLDETIVNVQSVNNEYQMLSYTMNMQINTTNGALTIRHNEVDYVQLQTNKLDNLGVIEYLGESGLILYNNTLIELKPDICDYNQQTAGLMYLDSDVPILLEDYDLTQNGSTLNVTIHDANLIYDIVNGYSRLCFTRKLDNYNSAYNDGLFEQTNYPNAYCSFLFEINLDKVYYAPETRSHWIAYTANPVLNSDIIEGAESNSIITPLPAEIKLTINYDENLPTISKDEYNCYLIKTNQVKIITNMPRDSFVYAVEVTSYNNL